MCKVLVMLTIKKSWNMSAVFLFSKDLTDHLLWSTTHVPLYIMNVAIHRTQTAAPPKTILVFKKYFCSEKAMFDFFKTIQMMQVFYFIQSIPFGESVFLE